MRLGRRFDLAWVLPILVSVLFAGAVTGARKAGARIHWSESSAPWALYRSTQYLGFGRLDAHEVFGADSSVGHRFVLIGGSSAQGAGPDYRWSFFGKVDYRDRCSIAYSLTQHLASREPGERGKVYNLAVNGVGTRTLTLVAIRALQTRPRGLLVFLEPGVFMADKDFLVVPSMNGELLAHLERLESAGARVSAQTIKRYRERLSPNAEPATDNITSALPTDEWLARLVATRLWDLVQVCGGPPPVEMRRTPEYLRRADPMGYPFLALPEFQPEGFEAAIGRNLGREMLEVIAATATAQGVRVLVVIPWSRFARGVPAVYERLRRLIAEAKLDYLDLSEANLEAGELSYDYAHLTVLGNRAVAKAILQSREDFFGHAP